jgi:membrane protease YdiL (CAAX protease family)
MGSTTSNTNNQTTDVVNSIFNKTNYIFVLWFLAIYVVAYFFIGLLFKKSNETVSFSLRLSRGIDFIVLIVLLVILFVSYFNSTESKREKIYENIVGSYSEFINKPVSFLSIVLSLVLFYVLVYLFRIPTASDMKPVVVSLLETALWITFTVICFVDFFKYVLHTSLTDIISDLAGINTMASEPVGNINILNASGKVVVGQINGGKFTGNLNVKGNTQVGNKLVGNLMLPQPVQQDEVFNISNNLYTYEDAQAICSAYGAKLATYDQVEDAYNHGAEWCNYGWSEDQMAFFPTQKSTWEKLQKNKKHKNDCGRPGVNGGYFANPHIKFGVNCYGKKPKPSDAELARMAANKDINIPISESDSKLNAKVNFWKQNAGNLLVLNSFDRTHWSEY